MWKDEKVSRALYSQEVQSPESGFQQSGLVEYFELELIPRNDMEFMQEMRKNAAVL